MVSLEEIQGLMAKGDYERVILLCQDSMEETQTRSDMYLLLGKALLATGRRREAIRAFRDGMLYGRNPRIREELERLGLRKPPLISSLARSHWLNRFLGKSMTLLRLR